MRKLNMAYGPHFAIDLHERGNTNINSSITNYFGAKFDNDAGDIGSSGSTILQVPKELTALRYKYMEPDLKQFGEKYAIYMGLYREGQDNYSSGLGTAYAVWNGYIPHPDDTYRGPYGPYSGRGHTGTWVTNRAFDADAPYFIVPEASFNHRSSRNINAMPGVISQLFENKSGPTNVGNRGMWERRVAVGYICMLSTITTAATRGNEIVPQLEAMRTRWIEKGKTYDPNDKIPIITIPPLPTYWDQKIDQGDGFPHHRDYGYWIIDLGTTATVPNASADNITGMSRYDMTKSIKSGLVAGTVKSFDMNGSTHSWVKDNSGEGRYQPMKFEVMWQGWNMRERSRPTAYIFEGPYAAEVAGRMLIAGIDVKRLTKDTTVNVEGWYYNAVPSVNFRDSGGTGWGANNRNVTIFPRNNKTFQKDSYVVFLGQLLTNLIPMYMEPDLPFSAGNGIMLTYMSVALGGNSSGTLAAGLVGREMPIYRYLGNVNALETYDMDFFLPLINRGAVPRFFSFHNQAEVAAIADEIGLDSAKIRVYDYDIQVHARAGNHTTEPALKDGKFDMALPTNKTSGYYILKKDGKYEKLATHSSMLGWNIATITIANHGCVPFTVDIASNDRPAVGDGSNRTIPYALPAWDDLIGVRIVEVEKNEIENLFKEFPSNAIVTKTGIKYPEMFTEKTTVLSNAMLDGWLINGLKPTSGTGWKANIVNGEVVITFTGNAYDEMLTVQLVKIGTYETMELDIEFSGERKTLLEWFRDETGCNAGFAMLALLALCPLFVRRK
jgi:Synergist-CTERM protein sorting domain-containing protein